MPNSNLTLTDAVITVNMAKNHLLWRLPAASEVVMMMTIYATYLFMSATESFDIILCISTQEESSILLTSIMMDNSTTGHPQSAAYIIRFCKWCSSTTKIQTEDVVATAAIVPVGMAFDASAKSPDRFEPAIIPENKKNTN